MQRPISFSDDDYEQHERLSDHVVSEIRNQNIDESDILIVISELGSPLALATMPLIGDLRNTKANSAVLGIQPLRTHPYYSDSITDTETLDEICQYYLEFPMEKISKELDNPTEDTILDRTLEYVIHAAELLINGTVSGFKKIFRSIWSS